MIMFNSHAPLCFSLFFSLCFSFNLRFSLRSLLLAFALMSLAIAPSFAIKQYAMTQFATKQYPGIKKEPFSSNRVSSLILEQFSLKDSVLKGSVLADGVYLYGQAAQAEKIGSEYLVFQIHQGKIRGAIYYPQSEFNCFTGAIAANQIKLSIRDPSDNRSYPYNIALVSSSAIANPKPSRVNITLKGYVSLQQLSANDQRILQACVD
jgi:hypothetical protein